MKIMVIWYNLNEIVFIFLWKMFVVQLNMQIYMCMMLRQLKCLCSMRDDVFNFS